MSHAASMRVPSVLLLGGQLLFIAVTLLHPGGDANHHPSVFEGYADSESWKAIHLGQFAAMGAMLAGLGGLVFAFDGDRGTAGRLARLGAASAATAFALYAVLQAVDGVALKQAVDAWSQAPAEETAARFAGAELIRWLEWGTRSYHTIALGLALLLFAGAMARASMPWPAAGLMALSGSAYLVQGWILGAEGFSPAQSTAIVATYVLNVAWMGWLVALSWRRQAPVAQQAQRPVRST